MNKRRPKGKNHPRKPKKNTRISAARRKFLSDRAKRQNRDSKGRFIKGFKHHSTKKHPIQNTYSKQMRPRTFDLNHRATPKSAYVKKLVEKVLDIRIRGKKRTEVADAIAENFAVDEITKMDDFGKPEVISNQKILDEIGKESNKKIEGYCRHKTKWDNHTIINLSESTDEYTIVHEFIHLLRACDKRRKKYARTAHDFDKNGRIVSETTDKTRRAEETATHAETALRIAWPRTPSHYSWEYSYGDTFSTDKIHKNYLNDRGILRRYFGRKIKDGVTIKGRIARILLNANYPKTMISKNHEQKERAIDIFDRIIKKRKE